MNASNPDSVNLPIFLAPQRRIAAGCATGPAGFSVTSFPHGPDAAAAGLATPNDSGQAEMADA